MQNPEGKVNDLGTKDVKRLILKLSVPTVLIMLVTSLYNAADTFFIGRIGTEAVAAVGISFSYMAIVQAIGFFFGHGSGNFISRALGAGNTDDAKKICATAIILSFASGIILMSAGLAFSTQIARLLGATDAIIESAKGYLKFIFIGTPFILTSFTINNQLRFTGQAKLGLIRMLSGAVLNIILDPIFIFVFKLGIAGASSATMVSQIAGFGVLLFISVKLSAVKFNPKNFSLKGYYLINIFKGGLPSLIRQSIASVAVMLLNRRASLYGEAAIAAFAVSNRLLQFVTAAVLGLGQGFQPVCGYNYGAKKFDRVYKAFFFTLFLAVGALVILTVLMYTLAPRIIRLFSETNDEVIRIGVLALRIQSLTLPLAGVIVLVNMQLQTTGKAMKASILALARQGIFLIPLIFILQSALGLNGLIYATPIADIFAFAMAAIFGGIELSFIKRAFSSQDTAE